MSFISTPRLLSTRTDADKAAAVRTILATRQHRPNPVRSPASCRLPRPVASGWHPSVPCVAVRYLVFLDNAKIQPQHNRFEDVRRGPFVATLDASLDAMEFFRLLKRLSTQEPSGRRRGSRSKLDATGS
ncbi:hypothetical protein PsorP6_015957 [Peronosclerospora sorghi]|uniref:Uncharacterized protein n=1 Tax=Peronosclerospora sorghi TaxID=230839 RepID=A0ACC0WNB4_9STRA|nr:hypothetical protein PsorP6_015957 [Peronosclerospora sorghi]